MVARASDSFVGGPDWYVTHNWEVGDVDVARIDATSVTAATGVWTITLGGGGGDATQIEINTSQIGTTLFWLVSHTSDTVKVVRFFDDTGAASAPEKTQFWARRVPATP